jgi:cytidylate kinase
MLITISGLPGSGKTTVARLLARHLGLPHIYAGDLYRRSAVEHGVSLEEFNALSEQDHSIDRALDAKMAEYARRGDAVLEGRLAGFIALQEGAPALKVFLTAGDDVCAQRVAQREDRDWRAVLELNRARQRSDAMRYRVIYGFDLDDTSIYDLILNTARLSTAEQTAAILALYHARFPH